MPAILSGLRRVGRRAFGAAVLLLGPGWLAGPGVADTGGDNSTVVIDMDFKPPAPGTYELMRIMAAPGGTVLDIDGSRHNLNEFTGGKVTLLSFIYSSCADPTGCPYAYVVFHTLKNRLERDPRFRGRVRLVSLSFDPVRDTPELLRLYAGDNAQPDRPVEWKFLTTPSLRELLPILDGYGQDVFLDKDPGTGQWRGTYSHMLKVFLIDAEHQIREVYTTAFLMPEMLYNDVVTLLMEKGFRP